MARRLLTAALLLGAVAAVIAAVLLPPRVGHPVTPLMREAAERSRGRSTPLPPGVAADRPAVVIFIADDCPCSEAYEPFTHRLFEAFGARASFVGVIDGDAAVADGWRSRHATPFPVVPDPDQSLARAYGAERSAYTAIVLGGGRLERLWPGYSAEMLRDLATRLAEATGGAPPSLDVADAPEKPTSGCSLGL